MDVKYRGRPPGRGPGRRTQTDRAKVAEVGRRVKVLRRARGLTMSQLGAAAGVCASSISQIESGRQSALVDKFARLAAALGVTMDALWFGDGKGATP